MATAPPDDGIPVLTDVVDAAAGAPVPAAPRAVYPPRTAAAASPSAAPASHVGPSARQASNVGASAGPAAKVGPAADPGPNSGFGNLPPLRPHPAPGAKAPPISGPPSLSEFNTGTHRTAPPPAAAGPGDAVQRAQAALIERVLARVDPLVEARLKEHLADTLEQVLAQLTRELKLSTGSIVREAVAQAVADEVAAQRARAPR